MDYSKMEPLITENDTGIVRFLLEVTELTKSCINFKVHEVVGWEHPSNEPCYSDLYLRGFIKWDGCAHFWMGEEDNPGYMHLCGFEGIINHGIIMVKLHDLTDRIENYDKDVGG